MESTPPVSEPLTLDHKSHMPLHAQAEILLRTMIQRPEYHNGGLLPDEVSLSRSLGISRNTLRVAIGRLVSEGHLERKSGIGTRVLQPRVCSGMGAWHSFTREMEARGVRVETYSVNLKVVAPPSEVARALQIDPDTQVLCLDRVRGWDATPEVHFRSYFHPRLGLTIDEDFHVPLYELIYERSRILADESKEELKAVAATSCEALLLGVTVGVPLLRRERTVLDTGQRPMEYAIVHYRCERFALTLNLRKSNE